MFSWMVVSSSRKFKGLWGMPPFFAHHFITKLPIFHPERRFCSPFQYRMRLIAFDTCGHQGTLPARIFLHCFSVWHLYSVAALSIFSYSSFCAVDRWFFTIVASCCALSAIPSFCSTSHRDLLYFSTIRGSLHWSRRATGHSIASGSRGQILWASTSIHNAL